MKLKKTQSKQRSGKQKTQRRSDVKTSAKGKTSSNSKTLANRKSSTSRSAAGKNASKQDAFQNAKTITVTEKSITIITKDSKSGKLQRKRVDRTSTNMRKVNEALERRKQKSFSVKF